MPILHGASASPFVRKVRIVLAIKGIDYDHEQVMPGTTTPEYLEKSPLAKIPCWEDGDLVLPDSSVIVAYLEKLQPEPAVYPSDPADYGRALWYEEYADTACAPAIGPKIFFQRVVIKGLMGKEIDEAAVEKAVAEDLPPVFDYLEGQVPETGDAIVGGKFSIADIAIGTEFVNLHHAGESVDANRWPKLAAYVERVHANPHFAPIIAAEKKSLGLDS